MQIHGLQSVSAAQSTFRNAATAAAKPTHSAASVQAHSADELELSAEAQQIGKSQGVVSTSSSNGIRTERVAELRQAIAQGNYETAEKMSAALDKMLDTFA